MSADLLTAIRRRIACALREASSASAGCDVYARDLMLEVAQQDTVGAAPALAHVQLVRSLVDEAVARLEQALREAGAVPPTG